MKYRIKIDEINRKIEKKIVGEIISWFFEKIKLIFS